MAERDVIDCRGYVSGFETASCKADASHGVVRMMACGDTGPVRNLQRIVLTEGPMHILGETASILNSADLVFANLEALYSTNGRPLNKVPVFRLHPEAFEIIKAAKINVASLANNHMPDYGPEAFGDTIGLLEQNNIDYFGAGLKLEQALKPAIVTVRGIKFGFLGFRERGHGNFDSNGVITPEINKNKVARGIKSLRPDVDILILSLHFGWEYQFYPSPKDVALCRCFIDSGADLVLGHHPHYPQGLEKYKSGLIVYSLGNFIWDQYFVGHTSSSYLLDLEIVKEGIYRAKVIPFQMNADYRMEIREDRESIDLINALSKVLLHEFLLDEKWYFICRDRFLTSIKELHEKTIRCKSGSHFEANWISSVSHPRAMHTWFSLVVYMLTCKAIQYEARKWWKKRQKKKEKAVP